MVTAGPPPRTVRQADPSFYHGEAAQSLQVGVLSCPLPAPFTEGRPDLLLVLFCRLPTEQEAHLSAERKMSPTWLPRARSHCLTGQLSPALQREPALGGRQALILSRGVCICYHPILGYEKRHFPPVSPNKMASSPSPQLPGLARKSIAVTVGVPSQLPRGSWLGSPEVQHMLGGSPVWGAHCCAAVPQKGEGPSCLWPAPELSLPGGGGERGGAAQTPEPRATIPAWSGASSPLELPLNTPRNSHSQPFYLWGRAPMSP